MIKTKMLILVAFVLALGAGVAVGMLGSRALPNQMGPKARFIEELQLTTQQQQQLEKIWQEMIQTKGRQFGEDMRAIQMQREKEIAELFKGDQKEEYDRINQRFAERMRDLWKKGEAAFEDTVQQTRQILNDWQKPKFDEMLKKMKAMHFDGNFTPPGGFGFMGAPTSAPSMQ